MTDWDTLVDCLYDRSERDIHPLPGQNWLEWVLLSQHDYDDVDKMLMDYETIGA